MTQDTQQILENHFKPGNVIYSYYWRNYDLVRAFELRSTPNGTLWVVAVQACDEDGNVLPGAVIRTHSTYPDFKRGDKVVAVKV